MRKKNMIRYAIPVVLAVLAPTDVMSKPLSLTLRTRHPATGALMLKQEKVDPHKIGIVIVDPWEYHWCMTWTEQAGGMAPRINRALEVCRQLGMSVFWGPTDTASMFSGWPQRQRALAIPYVPVPNLRRVDCRWTVSSGPCHCGPGIPCLVNYGFDGMDPRLEIAREDLIVSGTQELYSHCRARGLTHLIFFGGATNICLTGKDIGLGPMFSAGLETIFARDLAFAWTHYDPDKGFTPTSGNNQAADDLERAGIPTVILAEDLGKQGLWNKGWITEPVRITPSGTTQRPYFFEQSVTITLETPFLDNVSIHYTLDEEVPTPTSTRYRKPVKVSKTTTLRAAAFRQGRKVALDSQGYFVRLPSLPPKPEITLDRLTPVTDLYSQMSAAAAACLWLPRTNQSYEGKPLRIRGQKYRQGLGMRAPAYVRFQLKPEFRRFVGLAGVDDNMLNQELGRNIAKYPSVIFQVFLDGELAAQSPVMRISQVPWRFDVPIPPGSRQMVLVCDDAGSRSPYDLGNWVEVGFVLKK
jgi:hypothetical protein